MLQMIVSLKVAEQNAHIFVSWADCVEMVGSECVYADATCPQIYRIEGLFPPPVVTSPSHRPI